MIERCDACQQPIPANTTFYRYGNLKICASCDASAVQCDSKRLNAAKCLSTSDGNGKLLKAGPRTFEPGYRTYNNKFSLCDACDQALPKASCSGNCGRWLVINNTGLGVPMSQYVYGGTAQIRFCSDCENANSARCPLCGTPIARIAKPLEKDLFSGAGVYYGTDYRCKLCKSQAIADGLGIQYYEKIANLMAKLFDSMTASSQDVPPFAKLVPQLPGFQIVNHETLMQERAKRNSDHTTGIVLGFWTNVLNPNSPKKNSNESIIFIETTLPKALFLATEAHELTHAWQYGLALFNPKLPELNKKTKEGFAQWVAYTLLKESGTGPILKIDEQAVKDQMKKIDECTLANYGDGFQAFKKLEQTKGRAAVLNAAINGLS